MNSQTPQQVYNANLSCRRVVGDTDALRQLISMSIPQVFYSIIAAGALLVYMFLYSLWLLLVVIAGVLLMAFVAKFVGSRSARQQF